MLLRASVLLLMVCAPSPSEQLLTEQINSCKAIFPEGTIDLSPLDSLNKTGKQSFSNFAIVKIAGLTFELTYNPCSGFHCNSDETAAVCAIDTYKIGLSYDMASQSGSAISLSNLTHAQIRYASTDKVQNRDFVTLVTLACTSSEEDTLTLVQLSDANVLTFQLNSRHSCLIPHPAVGGWSPGDYIVFFFFLIAFLYFVVFLAINKFILKRSGVDVLPHRHAWAYLGLLVKDGCVFTFSSIRRRISQKSGYNEI